MEKMVCPPSDDQVFVAQEKLNPNWSNWEQAPEGRARLANSGSGVFHTLKRPGFVFPVRAVLGTA